MDVSRRDFMKLVGVTVASLSLTNCRMIPVTCYAPLPPSPYPTEPVTARERLRACWLRFGESWRRKHARRQKLGTATTYLANN
jgi:hypothetical protein